MRIEHLKTKHWLELARQREERRLDAIAAVRRYAVVIGTSAIVIGAVLWLAVSDPVRIPDVNSAVVVR